MAAKKAVGVPRGASKRVPKPKGGNARDLEEARKQNYSKAGKIPPLENPLSAEYIKAKRAQRSQEKINESDARQKALAEQVDPEGDHPDVVVAVKQTVRAAIQEQKRIDEGKEAAKRQKPFKPPQPGEEGRPYEWAHPEVPGARGSAPRSPNHPVGEPGQWVRYETDDILADGTPLVQGEPWPPQFGPEWYDGENDRDLRQVRGVNWKPRVYEFPNPDDPDVNQFSEEGALLDQMKNGRYTVYIPTEADQAIIDGEAPDDDPRGAAQDTHRPGNLRSTPGAPEQTWQAEADKRRAAGKRRLEAAKSGRPIEEEGEPA